VDGTMKLDVALSGAHAPGRSEEALWELIDYAKESENAGFDSVWLGDHIGFSGQPWFSNLLVLGAIARETRSVELGAFVLAAIRPPAVVADDLATLDIISAGRLTACFVAGWRKEEFSLVGSPYQGRTSRTIDAVDEVQRIWGARLQAGDGSSEQRLSPSHPVRIWLGGSGPRMAKAAATKGLGFIQSSHISIESAKALREARRVSGRPRDDANGDVALIESVYVANTDRQAWIESERYLKAYHDKFTSSGMGAAERGTSGAASQDDGRMAIGSPTSVAERLSKDMYLAGANRVICRLGWPGMPKRLVLRALDLLGNDVRGLIKK
jgi:alkanesulfonate monooxygenase SsuD/methylene tetrahydromethanopterin reductase-like flavin-dependent oxidoreductase (luciferase family)